MNSKLLLLLVAGSLAISVTNGCVREKDEAKYTVDEYLADARLREDTLRECLNNPGDLQENPDCINARVATAQTDMGSLRDLPPIGLQKESKTSSNVGQ